jgi:LysM repeat protein
MHRDVKLGLALGILIIGFAAAFCFPRRPVEDVAAAPVIGPKLALVDRDIRDLRVRSFVGEELDPAPKPTPADDNSGESSLTAGLESLTDAPLFNQPAAVPEPIRIPSPDDIVSTETSAVSTAAVASDSIEVPPPADVLTPEEERLYTVQPGDTLSRIASKLMGSAGKYGSLFEANKDILKSPSALQPGMVLKIPVTQQQETAGAVAERPMTPSETRSSLQDSIPIPQPDPISARPTKVASSLTDEMSTASGGAESSARAGKFRKAGAVPFTINRRGSRDE